MLCVIASLNETITVCVMFLIDGDFCALVGDLDNGTGVFTKLPSSELSPNIVDSSLPHFILFIVIYLI